MNPDRRRELFVEEVEGEWLVFDESSEYGCGAERPRGGRLRAVRRHPTVDQIVADLADRPTHPTSTGCDSPSPSWPTPSLVDYDGDPSEVSRRKALVMLGVAAVSLPVVERIMASAGRSRSRP